MNLLRVLRLQGFKKNASSGFEDLSLIDAAAVSGAALLAPPESSRNETESEKDFSQSQEVRRLRFPNPKDVDERVGPMKVPKVTRTYTKKAKHRSAQRNASNAFF